MQGTLDLGLPFSLTLTGFVSWAKRIILIYWKIEDVREIDQKLFVLD